MKKRIQNDLLRNRNTRLSQDLNKCRKNLEIAKKDAAEFERLAVEIAVTNQKPLASKKILAVEGQDEVNFFNALLKYMGITDFSIQDIAGKSNFKVKIKALTQATGFSDRVECFAIIRDADEDAEAAFTSLKELLEKLGFKPPDQKNQFSIAKPSVGIYIMPGDADKGMLEDLCLNIIKDYPLLHCVNSFFDCVSNSAHEIPRNMSKAKVQAFLAAMPDITNSLGLGAKKGYWDFNSDELKGLKDFLENLR